MLGRKRGGIADRSKKMAKKGAALQAEVNNDEEWLKILQRPGLVLVDIYSEWSGPCAGMVSVLKKIKMEIGGDDLSYAIAKSDYITSLTRFRGRSEPIWMFLQDGKTVNIAFGASCPQLTELLTREIIRVQKNEAPEFSVEVDEISEKEQIRMAAHEEARLKKEAALNARKEALAKKRYEAYMDHLKHSLHTETCMIMFPWCFKDEEGNKRDKKHSPQYIEMVESLFPNKFNIEGEVRKVLDDETLQQLLKETHYEFSDETKQLMQDGSAYIARLRIRDLNQSDLDHFLISLFYDETEVPEIPDALVEGCFVQRHLPPQCFINESVKEAEGSDGGESFTDKTMYLTTVWLPLNIRNRCMAFRTLFQKYVDQNYPYEEAAADLPIMLFKYDSTKKQELQSVYTRYANEVANFGVFERDNTPTPHKIADSILSWEKISAAHKTGYEVFVVVVRKDNNEAFLSFAGIGPYHVSENPEVAIEEAKVYFPPESEQEEEEENEEGEEGEQDEAEAEDAPN